MIKRPTPLVLFLVLLVHVLLVGCGGKTPPDGATTVRFGVLPVLQALELFAAADGGDFARAGLTVELVPFDTAADKDIALAAGRIDGYFGDLFTPIVVRGNGVDCRIVATNYDTRQDRRMFAVVGKPGGGYATAASLADVPVAISSNSVIHYVTATLLGEAGLAPAHFATYESKNIGIRMQMLMSGQLEAATLPEPLATAALRGGATLVADDRGLEASQTVLVFREAFLREHHDAASRFVQAVAAARERLGADPVAARTVMTANVRVPEALQATYPVPSFPPLAAPSAAAVAAASAWLRERGVLAAPLAYADIVDTTLVK